MVEEGNTDEPVPFRGRTGWTSTARLQAANQLRSRLVGLVDLMEVAETGAEYLRELMAASTVTVTSLSDGRYQDLVNVGYLPFGELRYPQDCYYPEAMYPASTKYLQEQGGYYSSDVTDDVFREWLTVMPGSDATSVMGVAIVSGGAARGEICMTRGPHQSAFDRQDFELVRDLATSCGTRLLVARNRAK